MAIQFQSLGSSFKLSDKAKISKFIQLLAYLELREIGDINYIFCTDDYLLKLNQQYLKHDTLTDIITFDYSTSVLGFEFEVSGSKKSKQSKQPETRNQKPETISADIFISIERVGENALLFKQPLNRELLRVMIHGVLHLCGYKDKLATDKKKMRAKEDYYLKLWEHTPRL